MSDLPKDAKAAIDWLLEPTAADRRKETYWRIALMQASDEIDRLRAEVERLQAELRRVTGPREPPHCPTCDCHSKSRAKRIEALRAAIDGGSESMTHEDALATARTLGARVAEQAALLDACAPYLKEGETPAECIARNRRDVDTAMTSMVRDRDDAGRYRWMKRVQEDGDESVTEWIGYYSAGQWDAEIDKHRVSEAGEKRCADNKGEQP